MSQQQKIAPVVRASAAVPQAKVDPSKYAPLVAGGSYRAATEKHRRERGMVRKIRKVAPVQQRDVKHSR